MNSSKAKFYLYVGVGVSTRPSGQNAAGAITKETAFSQRRLLTAG